MQVANDKLVTYGLDTAREVGSSERDTSQSVVQEAESHDARGLLLSLLACLAWWVALGLYLLS
jgi:hypothetical protein